MRAELTGLCSELYARFNVINGRFDKVEDHLGGIDADLRQFYHLTGKLEARMDSFEKSANSTSAMR